MSNSVSNPLSDPVTDPLSIIVYSDVICPWCYVGKRRLEAALDGPDMPAVPRLAWRPFELNPDMPAEGIERQAYRAQKFGAARSAELDRTMIETGKELGIAFAFDRMQRTPNTRLAHRAIWEAGRQGRQDALVNRLFQAYFEEARDIGEPQVLQGLAAEAGLEPAALKRALTDPDSLEAVVDLEQQGYRLGIQGVPFFILSQKYGVSGAQPPEFWRDALPRIAAEGTQPQTDAQG
jgi:predicted DsbA family dithiol-disulfide isomerase